MRALRRGAGFAVGQLNKWLRRAGLEIRPYRPVAPRLRSHALEEPLPSVVDTAADGQWVDANRVAWEEAAQVHSRYTFEKLLDHIRRTGRVALPEAKAGLFGALEFQGLDVAQLCCNNGRELLAIKQAGAGNCVGFDLSPAFMDQARVLADAAGLDCTFVDGDVYRVPASFNGRFDRVLVTAGALCCLPDMPGFFEVVTRLLKTGGQLYMHEIHPFLNMFPLNYGEESMELSRSYFDGRPLREDRGLDYFGRSSYRSSPHYWFSHTLSEIMTAALDNGLRLRSFSESPRDSSSMYSYLNKVQVELPLSYLLTAEKEERT